MKKIILGGLLGLATLALSAAPVSAKTFGLCVGGCFGCGSCCGSNCCSVLCIRQYNAFTPVCSGSLCCDGCMPFCQSPCPQPCGPVCQPPQFMGNPGCAAPAQNAPVMAYYPAMQQQMMQYMAQRQMQYAPVQAVNYYPAYNQGYYGYYGMPNAQQYQQYQQQQQIQPVGGVR